MLKQTLKPLYIGSIVTKIQIKTAPSNKMRYLLTFVLIEFTVCYDRTTEKFSNLRTYLGDMSKIEQLQGEFLLCEATCIASSRKKKRCWIVRTRRGISAIDVYQQATFITEFPRTKYLQIL